MTLLGECDVAVVGAGPAGAVAARELAGAGFSVLLLEKSDLPRYKTCGGGLVARALPSLKLDVGDVAEEVCHTAELNDLENGLHHEVSRRKPLLVMTMRARLDTLLAWSAREAGARLWTSCPVKHVRPRPDHVELLAGEHRIRARLVLAADGAAGVCAPAGGFGPRPRAAPALEWELQVPPATRARFARSARFDFGIPPHGYAWIFPKRGHLSAGMVSLRAPARNLKTLLQRYLHQVGLTDVTGIEPHGFLIPVHPRRGALARGRILLLGDAAGLADPVTCEGLSHALLSAHLAAEAVRRGGLEQPSRVTSHYNRSLARRVLPELRMARRLAALLYRGPRTRRFLLGSLGPTLIEAMVRVITGQATYRGLLLNPLNHLRLAARALRTRS